MISEKIFKTKVQKRNLTNQKPCLFFLLLGLFLLETLEKVEKNLGKADVRTCGNPTLFVELDLFIEACRGADKIVDQGVTSLLEKKVNVLRSSLAEPWNSDLLDLEDEDLLAKQTTPKKKENSNQEKKVFYKFSPLSQEKTVRKCPHCDAVFSLVRTYNNHMKRTHNGAGILTVKERKGHCK